MNILFVLSALFMFHHEERALIRFHFPDAKILIVRTTDKKIQKISYRKLGIEGKFPMNEYIRYNKDLFIYLLDYTTIGGEIITYKYSSEYIGGKSGVFLDAITKSYVNFFLAGYRDYHSNKILDNNPYSYNEGLMWIKGWEYGFYFE